jgi:hypothetical protein
MQVVRRSGIVLRRNGKVASSLRCCCDQGDNCCPTGESVGGNLWVAHDCNGSPTKLQPTIIPSEYDPWIVACNDNWTIDFLLICAGSAPCDYRLIVTGVLNTADPDCFDLDFEIVLEPTHVKCEDGTAWFPGFNIPECPSGICCTVSGIRTEGTTGSDPGATPPGDATVC